MNIHFQWPELGKSALFQVARQDKSSQVRMKNIILK